MEDHFVLFCLVWGPHCKSPIHCIISGSQDRSLPFFQRGPVLITYVCYVGKIRVSGFLKDKNIDPPLILQWHSRGEVAVLHDWVDSLLLWKKRERRNDKPTCFMWREDLVMGCMCSESKGVHVLYSKPPPSLPELRSARKGGLTGEECREWGAMRPSGGMGVKARSPFGLNRSQEW